MSEHFFTFQGQSMPGGDRLISVPGLLPGDRVLQVIAVAGGVGNFTGNFLPYCPGSDYIAQDSSDLDAFTFLLRVERAA
jgi:hypothetical protein